MRLDPTDVIDCENEFCIVTNYQMAIKQFNALTRTYGYDIMLAGLRRYSCALSMLISLVASYIRLVRTNTSSPPPKLLVC
jgi:hypothetical protein